MSNIYSFLEEYKGKIVVLASPYEKWRQEREKFLYTGTIKNSHRLREILDKEIIIEFDHLQDWDMNSEEFKKARAESEKWVNLIKKVLVKQGIYFKITDHKGKSPHIRFYVNELENYPKKCLHEYKLRLVEALLKEIKFNSKIVELDRSLLVSDKKLISLEGKPHFKPKWRGNIEEVVFENTKGNKCNVQKERMEEIQKDFATDNKEVNTDPVKINDIDTEGLIKIWKKHYKEGFRNALLMAFGGLCRRKDISLEDGKKLLKSLLEAVGKPEYYERTSKELCYSWEKNKDEVAVYGHLKKIGKNADKLYMKLKKCFVHQTTATSYYLTTTYYTTTLKSWGLLDTDKELYIEQLNKTSFIYNKAGKKGIAKVQSEKDEETKKWNFFLLIDNERYYFSSPIMEAPYNTPSLELVTSYLKGEFKPREFKKIIEDVTKMLGALYDFKFETDKTIVQLAIGQSYLVPFLESLFYLGIDATKGGGKTTLLELITFLQRHGYMGGDTSAASIPRLVHELQLSIGLDEIDQKIGLTGEGDSVAILRKGQRRNNPYVRCEGRNNIPKAYDVFGCHSFSFRTELEDAFMSRSLPIHTAKTNNNKLPVINVVKRKILKPLSDELFLWGIENFSILYKEYIKSCSNVVSVVGCSGKYRNQTSEEIRDSLYKELTEHLNSDALEVLQRVTGRNTELSFIALDIAKLLGLDIIESLRDVMQTKEETESISESYYLEALEDFLKRKYNNLKQDENYKKLDGIHAGGVFYPKNLIYQEYVQELQRNSIFAIGTKKYNSLLRDLGFLEGDTIINIRFNKIPKKCVIFSEKILSRLNIFQEGDSKTKDESVEDILGTIRDNDKGQGVSFEKIQEHLKDWSEETIERELSRLSKEGQVHEARKDIWKVLE